MRKLFLVAICAAPFLSLPALAQTGNSQNRSQTGNSSSSTDTSEQNSPQIRQKLMNDLQQDGFKDVRIVPGSFLVHATNKQGEPVVMIINPNSVFEVAQIGKGQGGSGSDAATASGNATMHGSTNGSATNASTK